MKNVAFVFPGQGSQQVGMLSAMIDAYPVVKNTFNEASSVLGYDMVALCLNNPQDQLNQTEFTQPAILTASVAMWRAFSAECSALPQWMAGHSLGEYSALVCAGAFDFKDALTLVSLRGKYMQEAVPEGEGALAAIIGLSDEAVLQLCMDMAEGDVLVPANYNTPGQVVIAGSMAAVTRAITVAKERGAKLAQRLPVSVPSHSLLMKPAALRLKEVIERVTFKKPAVSVVNNVDVACMNEPADIREALLRQLVSPVRWVEIIHYFLQQGVTHIVECGPGKVLSGLNKRIDRNLQLTSIYDPDTLSQFITTLRF